MASTEFSRSRPRLACRAEAATASARRKLERETGIEPATNSLEGCDSTTELLPPSRLPARRRIAASPLQARASSRDRSPKNPVSVQPIHHALLPFDSPTIARSLRALDLSPTRPATSEPRISASRVVAREGLEPSKAQGRQIYSLLRLTASLPRRCVVWLKSFVPAGPSRPTREKLAKGFEPPTG